MPTRLLSLLLLVAATVLAQTPSGPVVPRAAQPSPRFDARAATNAWLETVPPAERARSNAYFEGGCWLIFWNYLYSAGILFLFLHWRLSARLRNLAVRLIRRQWLQSFWYSIALFTAVGALMLPLTVYEGFFREHAYGLLNQSFPAWLRDASLAFGIAAVASSLLIATLLAFVACFPRGWVPFAALITISFLVVSVLVAPVYIAPLFNTYRPLPNSPLKNAILSLARANGISGTQVYVMDESRQSKRVSANVSGLFGTERITLNDNLLRRCSPQGVLSTMGHEMGHYVLHHIYSGVFFFSVIIAVVFPALRWIADRALRLWGPRWQIASVGDPAALPLLLLILSTFSFFGTPLINSYTRAQEYEADIFGLNAARQPDGEAEVDLLLGEYRKLDPTPIEEFFFFDHPSGRTRIYAAMRWKAENLCRFDKSLRCAHSTDERLHRH
ncbi:MAG TPA: M48 family metallopeptidase [Bryobacteraceae bacterium]